MALANRIDGLGREVVHFIEESRALEIRVLEDALGRAPRTDTMGMDASGLAVTIASLALLLSREKPLGVSTGHKAVAASLFALLEKLEPGA
ncbi:hypothetical protein [Novosphingobium malaysiense]|uniref:hypothetical protein n=1 Tax=Novosphingobium malaysiense TaxID=1348853 RepID=UPI00068A6AE0|nr:hypothetical protein [Novosphingobium malaysiense]